MKTLITALLILAAQQSFSASLQCDIYKSTGIVPFAPVVLPPAQELAKIPQTHKISSLGGLDVFADVYSRLGTEYVEVYTYSNGIRISSGTRLLLVDQAKTVVDARCEIFQRSPMSPLPTIKPGPTVD
jgi:hypothetical protein